MKLAIFDFDGTLLDKDTLPYLLKQWKIQGLSKGKYIKAYTSLIFLYIKYKSGISSKFTKEEMKLIAMNRFNRIFKGMKREEIEEFFYKSTINIKDFLYQPVVSEIQLLKNKGYHTVLLSGSYSFLLECIGNEVGLDTVIGTKMNYHNNEYQENQNLEIISGKLKPLKLKEVFHSIDWNSSLAFADSYSDIYILELVGQPVAVKPDNELLKIATQNNWRVIF